MADLISMLAACAGGGEKDPDFNQTVLLLHGDGTNGAQNNTFLDSSTNNFTITRNGNTTQGTFSPFSLAAGEWSNYFNGASYLSFADSADFTFNADFTIECWFNTPTTPTTNHTIFAKWGATAQEFILEYGVRSGSNARQVRFFWGPHSTGAAFLSSGSDAFNIGEWTHVAVTRSGSNCRLFVNGVVAATGTNGTAATDAGSGLFVGRYSDSAVDYLTGYVSNASILKGTAKYTAAFTPSTTPLSTSATNQVLLTCQSNRFVDANTTTTAKAVTVSVTSVQPFSPFAPTAAYSAGTNGGSGYFDGTGDYLSVADNIALDVEASDFTIEFFYYPLANPAASDVLFSKRATNGTFGGVLLSFGGTTLTPSLLATVNGTTWGINTASSQSFVLNQWNHCGVTRSGTTWKVFINAVVGVNQTLSGTVPDNSAAFVIGAGAANGDNPIKSGYISGFRLLKGTAIDFASTGIPTAPPTAITNTSLLLNFTNASIFDNTGKNVLETVGNAQIDTTTKKYGTGSMKFDGTGDYLIMKDTPEMAFGSGDFTIEFWLNSSDLSGSDKALIDFRPSGTNGAYPYLYIYQSKIRYWFQNADRIIQASTLSTGTWYHVALTRSGSGTKLFVNGTQEDSTYTNSDTLLVGTNRPVIGANSALGANFNGYIDDLRITKGVARYTANFTPPTAAFPNE